MLNTIGWVGSICLAICGLPQVYKSWKTKRADDISMLFLILWGLGELLTLIYVFPTFQLPLIFNYVTNIVLIGVIARYKL